MRHGAHIPTRRDTDGEFRTAIFDLTDHEFLDQQGYGLQHHGLSTARRLVGGLALHFLGGKRRRRLLDLTAEASRSGLDLVV